MIYLYLMHDENMVQHVVERGIMHKWMVYKVNSHFSSAEFRFRLIFLSNSDFEVEKNPDSERPLACTIRRLETWTCVQVLQTKR